MYQDRRLAKVNPITKKVGQVVVGFGLLFATALAFQNCSGYQMYDTASTDEFASGCGSECNLTVAGTSLKTTNSLIALQEATLAATGRLVDIAGYCDDAEYPQSRLEYQWVEGSTGGSWVSTNASCSDLGRFHLKAVVPSVTANLTKFKLYFRLVVTKSDGTSEISPVQPFINIDVTK